MIQIKKVRVMKQFHLSWGMRSFSGHYISRVIHNRVFKLIWRVYVCVMREGKAKYKKKFLVILCGDGRNIDVWGIVVDGILVRSLPHESFICNVHVQWELEKHIARVCSVKQRLKCLNPARVGVYRDNQPPYFSCTDRFIQVSCLQRVGNIDSFTRNK